jgi:hypothetical protein
MDAVDRVLDVGRKDADRIEREQDSGEPPQPRPGERDAACDLADPGQQHRRAGERHPIRHDQQKFVGEREVGDAGEQVEGGHHPAHDEACARVG